MSDSPHNFSVADVSSVTLTAVPGSVRAALSASGGDDLMLVNLSTATIFVRTGDATVTADATAMPILAGEKGVYSIGHKQGRVTYIAAYVAVGAEDLIIMQGSGV